VNYRHLDISGPLFCERVNERLVKLYAARPGIAIVAHHRHTYESMIRCR